MENQEAQRRGRLKKLEEDRLRREENFRQRMQERDERIRKQQEERAERIRQAQQAREERLKRAEEARRARQAQQQRASSQAFKPNENREQTSQGLDPRIIAAQKDFPLISDDKLRTIIDSVADSRELGLQDRDIYRNLAREFHPDAMEKPTAGDLEIMKLINSRYDQKANRLNL